MWYLAVGAGANDPFLEWLSRAGSVGVLAAAVIAFLRGWIVSGHAFEQVREERDRALELVYKQAGLAHRAVDLSAERLELETEILELRKRTRS